MKLTAVVVTYNRLSLLKRTVNCLLEQTCPLDQIYIVNNGSTDGTKEWLDSQEQITVIHQANVGGSGGFYTGIQRAFQDGADWIWCMDDDVFPRPTCLELLLKETNRPHIGILAPRRLLDGKIYTNDFQEYDLTHPFASMYQQRLAKQIVDSPVEIKGTAFEGPFIHRDVVDTIGLPNKDFFIFCDDTDYCLRAVKAGFKIYYIPDALMDKQLFFSNDSWAVRNQKKKWKRFYQIRNATYLNHHYGENIGVKYLRGFMQVIGYIIPAFFTAPFSKAWNWKDIPALWKAYQNGLKENLGK
jgi:GT2 family glycosyltransferase